MIGSILRVIRQSGDADSTAGPSTGEEISGLSRLGFFKLMAGGALVAGAGIVAGAHGKTKGLRVPPVKDIDTLYDAWQNRLNSGDLEGLVDLYVDDVTYVNPDGKLLFGQAAVRADFVSLLALKPQIVLGDRKHLLYHDVALTTNHWRMTIPGPDGKEQVLTGGGIEVMRKQADGGWRYMIDDASRSASK